MTVGTVTVSELTYVTMRTPKPSVHLYFRMFNNLIVTDDQQSATALGPFDPHHRNMFGYIIRPNEEHLMVKRMPVTNTQKQWAYKIRLTAQNIQMAVGQGTPLSVLLNLGCFHVEHVEWRGQLGEPWSGPLLPH
jgi:hypothetical protein